MTEGRLALRIYTCFFEAGVWLKRLKILRCEKNRIASPLSVITERCCVQQAVPKRCDKLFRLALTQCLSTASISIEFLLYPAL